MGVGLNIRCAERLTSQVFEPTACVQVGGFARKCRKSTQIRQFSKKSRFWASDIANHDHTILGSYRTLPESKVCASYGHSSQKGVLRFILSLPRAQHAVHRAEEGGHRSHDRRDPRRPHRVGSQRPPVEHRRPAAYG